MKSLAASYHTHTSQNVGLYDGCKTCTSPTSIREYSEPENIPKQAFVIMNILYKFENSWYNTSPGNNKIYLYTAAVVLQNVINSIDLRYPVDTIIRETQRP